MDNIEAAVGFFASTFFIAFGLLVLAGMILAINNLFSRYWKKVVWLKLEPYYVSASEYEKLNPNG